MQRLAALFRGYEGNYGTYVLSGKVTERGKAEGKAITRRGTLTRDHWAGHVAGTGFGVGVIPLMADDTVVFAAIDVDVYPLDLKVLERKLGRLPLVVCRTKSGGAHLYLFLKEPLPASTVVPVMQKWAAHLGYGDCEIFPKQTSRADGNDVGNWINMPYFGNKTERYAIKDGKALSLPEFLEHASQTATNLKGLVATFHADNDEAKVALFENGPPCLAHLAGNGGFPDGSRNEGMFNVMVYLKKRWPDAWKSYVQRYNVALCHPEPVELSELSDTMKSVGRKDYQYKCRQQPIRPYCNRAECVKREFGITSTWGGPKVEISSLTKYEGSPVIWVAEIDGHRLQMTTSELYNQSGFNQKCMDSITVCPGSMPKPAWEKFLNDLMGRADVVPPIEETTEEGQFYVLLEQFCSTRAFARTLDETIQNKPFKDRGKVYFRSRALLDYLDNQRFKYKSAHHVWQMLRDRHADTHPHTIKGRCVNLWEIDADSLVQAVAGKPPDFGETPF